MQQVRRLPSLGHKAIKPQFISVSSKNCYIALVVTLHEIKSFIFILVGFHIAKPLL